MKKYFSLIKFSHSIFALPFAVIGFLLASTTSLASFNLEKFGLMLACMVFARSAAMAFNRYADREYDGRNPRTKSREIPAGLVAARSALLLTIGCSLAFMVCTWFINPLCFYLSPVALVVVLGYSLTKRFTALCHFVLGLGLSLAPIGAYLVISGHFAVEPVLFSLAVLTWVSGFDIMYALPDSDFDIDEQLHSVPAAMGRRNALRLSRFLHVCSAVLVIIAGFHGHFGLFYWTGVLVYCSLLIYQHTLVRPADLTRLNLAFFTMNGVASVVFALFFIADHFLHIAL